MLIPGSIRGTAEEHLKIYEYAHDGVRLDDVKRSSLANRATNKLSQARGGPNHCSSTAPVRGMVEHLQADRADVNRGVGYSDRPKSRRSYDFATAD
jgi:hypothetical protein